MTTTTPTTRRTRRWRAVLWGVVGLVALAAVWELYKLVALRELGVDQFAVYLQHDQQEETLAAYAQTVIPALVEHARAKT